MKIAIDLHGTIDKYPAIFKRIMRMLVLAGIEVSVMSGPPIHTILKHLSDNGFIFKVHFSDVYSVVDYLQNTNTPMHEDSNGRWWASDENWWSAKGKLCKNYGINVLLDNEIKYKKAIPEGTEFIHFEGL